MAVKKLDVRGAKCPIPIVRAKKEIDAMAPGDVLEVTATDSGSVPDFQGWVKTAKHVLLREQRSEKDATGRELYIHVVERTG
jgi:TusA-related sulfurtransferase